MAWQKRQTLWGEKSHTILSEDAVLYLIAQLCKKRSRRLQPLLLPSARGLCSAHTTWLSAAALASLCLAASPPEFLDLVPSHHSDLRSNVTSSERPLLTIVNQFPSPITFYLHYALVTSVAWSLSEIILLLGCLYIIICPPLTRIWAPRERASCHS